jgi:hypothetical protein
MEKSKLFNKRIKKDVENLINLYPNNKILVDDVFGYITLELYDNEINTIDDNVNPIYKFIIKKMYPFSPPDVYYKNLHYDNIYKISSQRQQTYLKQLTSKDCLCCCSILCSNNWCISLNFFDIIHEINNFRKIKKNIFIKIIVDQIKNKYLVSDINLDCYLFAI